MTPFYHLNLQLTFVQLAKGKIEDQFAIFTFKCLAQCLLGQISEYCAEKGNTLRRLQRLDNQKRSCLCLT